VFLKKYFR